MSKFDDLLEFNVGCLNSCPTPLKTVVSHAVQGEREVLRFEQASANPDEEADVVIIDKEDYLKLYHLLKGH